MKTKFMLSAFIIVMLSACGDNDEWENEDTNGKVELGVSASVNEGKMTRASNTTWYQNDKIGIYGTSGNVGYTNVQYICKEPAKGNFQAYTTAVYYGAETGTFTAYHPYLELNASKNAALVENGKIKLDTSDQLEREVDYLYAPAVSGSKQNPEVAFIFDHKMSKLALHLGAGVGVGAYEDIPSAFRFELSPLAQEGTFDPATGVIEATGTPSVMSFTQWDKAAASVDTENQAAGYQSVFNLYLLPQQTIIGGLELRVISKNPEVVYKAVLKDADGNLTLEPGMVYDFFIKVNKTAITVNGATISEWRPAVLPDGGKVDTGIWN